MEDLLKQVRSKFSGKEEFGSARGQRTPSFRGERGPQNWLRRTLSRQMSYKEPSEDPEYAAAVAAAAFAITSLEPDVHDERKPEFEPQFSLPRVLSGIVDRIASAAAPGEVSERLQDEHQGEEKEMMPEKTIHPVSSTKRTPSMPKRTPSMPKRTPSTPKRTPSTPKKRLTFADEMQEDSGMPFNYPEKTPTFDKGELEEPKRIKPTNSFTRRIPSMKRTPSSGDEQIPYARTPKQDSSPPIHYPPPPIPPPPAVPPLNIEPRAPPKQAIRPVNRKRDADTDADDWERQEMAKIKERYERLNTTILEWEDKKKRKARRKLETAENEREKRRTKALQNYQIEMERIKQIADGARAQAKDKRRNEELKVKEKANRYRTTGEPPMPPVCLCL